MPEGAFREVLTCTCFASIQLFVLALQVHVEEETEKVIGEQQRADWIL